MDIPARDLIEKLAQAFAFYRSKDLLTILIMEGSGSVGLLAGLPLEKYGIDLRRKNPPRPQRRHLVFPSSSREARGINAAYLITQFWRTKGPKFIRRQRKRRIAAYLITRFWRINGPKIIRRIRVAYLTPFWPKFIQRKREKNVAYLIMRTKGLESIRRQRKRRIAAYLITQFWRINGPGFIQRKRERNAAHLITRYWRTKGLKFIWRQRKRRIAAYRITQFWRTNGPEFIQTMKRKRVYLVQLQKPRRSGSCCMLVEMKYGNDWIF